MSSTRRTPTVMPDEQAYAAEKRTRTQATSMSTSTPSQTRSQSQFQSLDSNDSHTRTRSFDRVRHENDYKDKNNREEGGEEEENEEKARTGSANPREQELESETDDKDEPCCCCCFRLCSSWIACLLSLFLLLLALVATLGTLTSSNPSDSDDKTPHRNHKSDPYTCTLLGEGLLSRLHLLQTQHRQQQQQQQQQQQYRVEQGDVLAAEYIQRFQVACVCEGDAARLYALDYVCANPHLRAMDVADVDVDVDMDMDTCKQHMDTSISSLNWPSTFSSSSSEYEQAGSASSSSPNSVNDNNADAAVWHFSRLTTVQHHIRTILLSPDARDAYRDATTGFLDFLSPTSPPPSTPPSTMSRRLLSSLLLLLPPIGFDPWGSDDDAAAAANAHARSTAAAHLRIATKAAVESSLYRMKKLEVYEELAAAVRASAEVACKVENLLRYVALRGRKKKKNKSKYDVKGQGAQQLGVVDRQQLFWITCQVGRETTLAIREEYSAVYDAIIQLEIIWGKVNVQVDGVDGEGVVMSSQQWVVFVTEMVRHLETLAEIDTRFSTRREWDL